MNMLRKVIFALYISLFVVVFLATAQAASDLNDKLMGAAESGNVALVKKLLAQGANPNYMRGEGGRKVTSGGYTVLMCAAHGADSDQGNDDNLPLVVKILLAHGAKANLVTNDGVTALQEAATYGKYEIVALLLKAGAVDTINVRSRGGRTALGWALINAKNDSTGNYSKTINILRQHGAKE
jgi:ankyrin repeat protein